MVAAVAVPVSIDTYKAQVAARALAAGASLVNDVWGLRRDPEMAGVVARAAAPVVLMHNKPGGGYHDLIGEIASSLLESVELGRAAGILEDRIILDPGIGFGKTREENLEIIRRLPELRRLGFPLLIGAGRRAAGRNGRGGRVEHRRRCRHRSGARRQGDGPGGADGGRHSGHVTRVWLALGSNLGDRAGYLEAAREALPDAGITLVRASRVAETEPVGVHDQPRFLNQVLEVETSLEPRPLLEAVKKIEQQLGRSARQRWGPREIDIDILRYDGRTVDEPGLHIPHAELQNRPFLLELLADLEAR